MKKLLTILFLLPLFVSSQYSATYTQRDTTNAVDTPVRPNTGLSVDFQNLNQTIPWPLPAGSGQHGKVVYIRITAHSILSSWTEWDSYFTLAGSRNEKVAVRINVVDDSYSGNTVSGNVLAYPNSWHTTMQGEANPDFTIGGVWWPNYNSTSFKANVRALMVTVAAHMNATTVGSTGKTQKQLLAYWDVGCIGNYGEMHTFVGNAGGTWTFPTGTFWTLASLQEIVNGQKDNITNIPFIYNINVAASNSRMPTNFPSWLMTQTNGWGHFGMRYDNSGNKTIFDFEYTNNNGSDNGVVYKTALSNVWQTAPVVSEPIQFGYSGAGLVDYYNIKSEFAALRVLNIENFRNIENNGAVPANTAALFHAMSRFNGPRLTIRSLNMTDSIRVNGTFIISPLFANVGSTPIYEHLTVTYYLYKAGALIKQWNSSFDPFLQLPGQLTVNDNTTMTGTFAAGTDYSIWVKFNYPDGYWPFFPLQMNVNRTSDGKYLLRSGIAVAVQGVPPPPPPPPPVNNPPVILPISDYNDTLPKNIDTLVWNIYDIDANLVTYAMTMTSGPNSASMGPTSTGSLTSTTGQTIAIEISGLIAGTYQFTLSANDGRGGLASRTVNVFVVDSTPVVVPPPPPPVIYAPPTIDAGDTIHTTMPKDSVTLTGHVLTKDTAIQSVLWTRVSGSGATTGTIVTPTDSTTRVRGLSVGYYLYRYRVTDKAGNIVDDYVYVFVDPFVAPDPIPLPKPPLQTKFLPIVKP